MRTTKRVTPLQLGFPRAVVFKEHFLVQNSLEFVGLLHPKVVRSQAAIGLGDV
jgi:hypothetical protein